MRFSHSTAVTTLVYISLSISELQEHASSQCSLLWYTKGIAHQQNYDKIGAASLHSTCLHVYNASSQVIESQELACRIVCMGRRCFVWFSKKDVYTNCTIPLFCTSPNSITSLSFRWWSSPVSEIREFNRKKMNTNYSKSGSFRFDSYISHSPNEPIFSSNLVFDGMVTVMLLEVQIDAH